MTAVIQNAILAYKPSGRVKTRKAGNDARQRLSYVFGVVPDIARKSQPLLNASQAEVPKPEWLTQQIAGKLTENRKNYFTAQNDCIYK